MQILEKAYWFRLSKHDRFGVLRGFGPSKSTIDIAIQRSSFLIECYNEIGA